MVVSIWCNPCRAAPSGNNQSTETGLYTVGPVSACGQPGTQRVPVPWARRPFWPHSMLRPAATQICYALCLFLIRVLFSFVHWLVVLMDTVSGRLEQIPTWALGWPVQCQRLVSRTGKPSDASHFASSRASAFPFLIPSLLPPCCAATGLLSGIIAASVVVPIIPGLRSRYTSWTSQDSSLSSTASL